MEDMEKSFSTKMQLQAAERMWGDKETEHRNRATIAFKRLCWIGGIGTAVMLVVYGIINLVADTPVGFNVAHTIAYLIPTLIFIWLLRILANEYKSNQEMADDAEERQAMVMTFKALEYEQRVGDEERLVILNALFRPYGGGTEETVPLPVWEAVIQRLQKSGSS